jgi:tRNA-guanine family transglycosylase
MSKDVKGLFIVIDPDRTCDLRNYNLSRIMTSVRWISKKFQNKPLRESLKFEGTIFLDCGVFQFFNLQQKIIPEFLLGYREKLIKLYNVLHPDIASSLDIPFPITSDNYEICQRLKWSIQNYKYMKEKLESDIELVLGICAYNFTHINLVRNDINDLNPTIIGLGGQVPLIREGKPQYGKITLRVINMLRKNFPEKSIHVYGLGDIPWYGLVRLAGADSSDFASYIGHSIQGKIYIPGTQAKFVHLLNQEDKRKLEGCPCNSCRKYGFWQTINDWRLRLQHNIFVLNKESNIIDEMLANNDEIGLIRHIKNYLSDTKFKVLLSYVAKLRKL